MACFEHDGPTTAIKKGSGTKVFLPKQPPTPLDYGVSVFFWEPSECGCQRPAKRNPFQYSATLLSELSFLSEPLCRSSERGRELLFVSMTRVSNLRDIQPEISGCE